MLANTFCRGKSSQRTRRTRTSVSVWQLPLVCVMNEVGQEGTDDLSITSVNSSVSPSFLSFLDSISLTVTDISIVSSHLWNCFIPFEVTGRVHMQGPPLDEWPVHHRALYEHLLTEHGTSEILAAFSTAPHQSLLSIRFYLPPSALQKSSAWFNARTHARSQR